VRPPAPRVVVTDLGVVSAAGVGVEAAWACVEAGRTCIGPIRSFDASRAFPGALGAEIDEVPRAGRDDDERALRLLLAAADDLSPGLPRLLAERPEAARRTAVAIGTSKGAVLAMAPIHRRFATAIGVAPMTDDEARAVSTYRPGTGAERLAERLGARGPRSTLGLACASGSMAILHAAELIRAGVADRAVAGGYDGFSPFVFTGFDSIGALTRTCCRPFDRRRDGTVLGEGAALVVLETEEAARERGARPRAWLEGGGYTADGVHLTAPDREGRGLAKAVRQALRDARVEPGDVDYVNAHGTGTRFNDAMECEAFGAIFGGSRPPVSSIKSIFGHTLGAAGALDVAMCVVAMERQVLPPTAALEDPEPEGWDFVPGRGRPASSLDVVLTTNSGFGGNNTALVLRRHDPGRPG
jgi:3-oxoacyl-(acyl-carrier-protein) synthase